MKKAKLNPKETKEAKFSHSPSTNFINLPTVLRNEISQYVPGSVYNQSSAVWSRNYRNSSCENPPQRRSYPISVEEHKNSSLNPDHSISNFYCVNHPEIGPQFINGRNNPPCCLPLEISTIRQWEQLINFIYSFNYVLTFFSETDEPLQVYSDHDHRDRFLKRLLEIWFGQNYMYMRVGDRVWYMLNSETGIYESIYPPWDLLKIFHNSSLSQEFSFILASDLPDEEIIAQLNALLDTTIYQNQVSEEEEQDWMPLERIIDDIDGNFKFRRNVFTWDILKKLKTLLKQSIDAEDDTEQYRKDEIKRKLKKLIKKKLSIK